MTNSTPLKIKQAIDKGLEYLHQHQYPNGEFCCYIGHEDDMKDTIPDSNIFPTSLICYSLLNLREVKKANDILELSSSFLQFQSMRGGVWNHFTLWHPFFSICPADVDNTACASKVLQALKKEYPDNSAILLANRNKNGLFYTWFTLRPNRIWIKNYWLLLLREFKHPFKSMLFWMRNSCSRNDVDAAVNANVLFYLGLNENTRPIVAYLLEIIEKKKEDDCDKWYRNPFSVYYFISRNYCAGVKELEPAKHSIIERILASNLPNGSFGNGILDSAWGIISLINFGYDSSILDKAIDYLIFNQSIYGDWPRSAVYYGGPEKKRCYGSEEMTTGFCLEALSSFQQRITANTDENI